MKVNATTLSALAFCFGAAPHASAQTRIDLQRLEVVNENRASEDEFRSLLRVHPKVYYSNGNDSNWTSDGSNVNDGNWTSDGSNLNSGNWTSNGSNLNDGNWVSAGSNMNSGNWVSGIVSSEGEIPGPSVRK